jgi:hypothetical protein
MLHWIHTAIWSTVVFDQDDLVTKTDPMELKKTAQTFKLKYDNLSD